MESDDMVSQDQALFGDWHVVARASDVRHDRPFRIRLLQQDIDLWREAGNKVVGRATENRHPVSSEERYGLVWVCLGNPRRKPIQFPEFGDERYQRVLCGPYGVRASGPRIIENFLDGAHLPFVHTGILGQEPFVEVLDYDVAPGPDGDGPFTENCMFWQPKPTVVAASASHVRYTYRVLRPFSAVLTKVPEAGGHGLSIFITVQPVEPEYSVVWILYAVMDHAKSDVELRARQELVFMQDKPILENQRPILLPLDPTAELSVRCDRLSLAYRRYLKEQGLRFGVSRTE